MKLICTTTQTISCNAPNFESVQPPSPTLERVIPCDFQSRFGRVLTPARNDRVCTHGFFLCSECRNMAKACLETIKPGDGKNSVLERFQKASRVLADDGLMGPSSERWCRYILRRAERYDPPKPTRPEEPPKPSEPEPPKPSEPKPEPSQDRPWGLTAEEVRAHPGREAEHRAQGVMILDDAESEYAHQKGTEREAGWLLSNLRWTQAPCPCPNCAPKAEERPWGLTVDEVQSHPGRTVEVMCSWKEAVITGRTKEGDSAEISEPDNAWVDLAKIRWAGLTVEEVKAYPGRLAKGVSGITYILTGEVQKHLGELYAIVQDDCITPLLSKLHWAS